MKKVIALGFFDGVHLGHGALLERTVAVAGERGLTPAACTFDTHPAALIAQETVPLLTTPEDREALMRELYGIGEVIVAPFDRAMMTMPWEAFVTDYLVERHQARHLVAGHDYRFGYRGEGTLERLQALCRELGVGCDIIGEVKLEGKTVSSTLIRELVERGELAQARRFLGHPYGIRGWVAHGKGLGGKLGFPTVNLAPDSRVLLPAHGVYAARAVLPDGQTCLAAVNVGVRPTVDDGEAVSVEGFLLDFDGALYGQELTLELYHRLRGERKFGSLEELRTAVQENARETRAYFDQISS